MLAEELARAVLASFVSGLISGLAIQHFQFKRSLKLEKTKRLSPYLEQVYPIVEKLCYDSDYAAKLHQRDDEKEFKRVSEKLVNSIWEYSKWFSAFRADGMMPELGSLDENLLSRFVGVHTHAQLTHRHGLEYISQRILSIAESCGACKTALEGRLAY